MANQAHSGIQGVPWHRCSRCGTDQRVSDLVRQNGQLRCRSYDCVDNRLVERRPRIISEVLSGSSEEMQPADILRVDFVDDDLEIV